MPLSVKERQREERNRTWTLRVQWTAHGYIKLSGQNMGTMSTVDRTWVQAQWTAHGYKLSGQHMGTASSIVSTWLQCYSSVNSTWVQGAQVSAHGYSATAQWTEHGYSKLNCHHMATVLQLSGQNMDI